MEIGKITAKNKEVLLLVAQGYSDYSIAERLGLSLRGVQHHISELRRLLDVEFAIHDFNPRTRLIRQALVKGLITPEDLK